MWYIHFFVDAPKFASVFWKNTTDIVNPVLQSVVSTVAFAMVNISASFLNLLLLIKMLQMYAFVSLV